MFGAWCCVAAPGAVTTEKSRVWRAVFGVARGLSQVPDHDTLRSTRRTQSETVHAVSGRLATDRGIHVCLSDVFVLCQCVRYFCIQFWTAGMVHHCLHNMALWTICSARKPTINNIPYVLLQVQLLSSVYLESSFFQLFWSSSLEKSSSGNLYRDPSLYLDIFGDILRHSFCSLLIPAML